MNRAAYRLVTSKAQSCLHELAELEKRVTEAVKLEKGDTETLRRIEVDFERIRQFFKFWENPGRKAD